MELPGLSQPEGPGGPIHRPDSEAVRAGSAPPGPLSSGGNGAVGDRSREPGSGGSSGVRPRFSYRDRYLPEIYQEASWARMPRPKAMPPEPTSWNGFSASSKGFSPPWKIGWPPPMFSTDPDAAPSEALEWLASWIGISLEPAFPLTARRRLLREALILFREHGTPAGMVRALDIATEGAVLGGRIVVVEDFSCAGPLPPSWGRI